MNARPHGRTTSPRIDVQSPRINVHFGSSTAALVFRLVTAAAILPSCGAPDTEDLGQHGHPKWQVVGLDRSRGLPGRLPQTSARLSEDPSSAVQPAKAQLSTLAQRRQKELRYFQDVGLVDGVTCESWPKTFSLQKIAQHLAQTPSAASGPAQAVSEFVQQVKSRGVDTVTAFGSKYPMNITEGKTLKGQQFVAVVDSHTRKGYAISHTLLCEAKDIAAAFCYTETLNGFEILLRSPRDHTAHERYVAIVAPKVTVPKDLRADVSLLISTTELVGNSADPVVIEVRPHSPDRTGRPFFDNKYLTNDQWRQLIGASSPRGILAVAAERISGVKQLKADFDVPFKRIYVDFPWYQYDLKSQRSQKAFVKPNETLWVPLGHLIEEHAPKLLCNNGMRKFRVDLDFPMLAQFRSGDQQGGYVAAQYQQASPSIQVMVSDLPPMDVVAHDNEQMQWDQQQQAWEYIHDSVQAVHGLVEADLAVDWYKQWDQGWHFVDYYKGCGFHGGPGVPALEICYSYKHNSQSPWAGTRFDGAGGSNGDGYYFQDGLMCYLADREESYHQSWNGTKPSGLWGSLCGFRYDACVPNHAARRMLSLPIKTWFRELRETHQAAKRYDPALADAWRGRADATADAQMQQLAWYQQALSQGSLLDQLSAAATVEELELGVISTQWKHVRDHVDRLDAFWQADTSSTYASLAQRLGATFGTDKRTVKQVLQRASYLANLRQGQQVRLNAIDAPYGALETARTFSSGTLAGDYFTVDQLLTRWSDTALYMSTIETALQLQSIESQIAKLNLAMQGLLPAAATSITKIQSAYNDIIRQTNELITQLKSISDKMQANLDTMKSETEKIWNCSFATGSCTKDYMLGQVKLLEDACKSNVFGFFMELLEVIPYVGQAAKAVGWVVEVGVKLETMYKTAGAIGEVVKKTAKVAKKMQEYGEKVKTAAEAVAKAFNLVDKLAKKLNPKSSDNLLNVAHCSGAAAAGVQAAKTSVISLHGLMGHVETEQDLINVLISGHMNDIGLYATLIGELGTINTELMAAKTKIDVALANNQAHREQAKDYIEGVCRATQHVHRLRMSEAYHASQFLETLVGRPVTSSRIVIPATRTGGKQTFDFLTNAWENDQYGLTSATGGKAVNIATLIADRYKVLFEQQICKGGQTAGTNHKLLFPLKKQISGEDLERFLTSGKLDFRVTLDDLADAEVFLQQHGAYLDPIRGIDDQGKTVPVSPPVVMDIYYRAYTKSCPLAQSVMAVSGCAQASQTPYLYLKPAQTLQIPTTACFSANDNWTEFQTATATVETCLKNIRVHKPWGVSLEPKNGVSDVNLLPQAHNCQNQVIGSLMDYPKGLPVLGQWHLWANGLGSSGQYAQLDVVFVVGVEAASNDITGPYRVQP